jgi:hypothetical protein
MRIVKPKTFMNIAMIISLFVIFCSSCKKDEVINPDYFGSWSTTQIYNEGGTSYSGIVIFTFSNDTFIEMWQLRNKITNNLVNWQNIKGPLTVTGKTMNFKVTSIGISTFDQTGYPTGNIINYKEGTSIFNQDIVQTGYKTVFSFDYSVSGNQITLTADGTPTVLTKY